MSRVVQLNPPMKGLSFVRMAIAATVASGDTESTAIYARERFGADSLAFRIADAGGTELLAINKAEVAAGATVSANWASVLADAESAATEFFSLVRDRSLLGRIPGFRRVPLRVRLVGAASGFSAAWVGEGQAKPISSATYDENTLEPLKVACLSVFTNELLRSLDPAAETLIRNDMVAAVAAAIDTSFLDPDNAGDAGIEPASVTNGAPSVSATGDGLADLRLLLDVFPGDLERAVLIGSPKTFAALHDPAVLPGLGVRGGNALGIPAFASTAAGDTLTLIDPEGIALGEGTMDLRVSSQASIEMVDSNAAGNSITVVPGAAASTVSLWQCNSTAMMSETRINWEAARPAAATLEGVLQS